MGRRVRRDGGIAVESSTGGRSLLALGLAAIAAATACSKKPTVPLVGLEGGTVSGLNHAAVSLVVPNGALREPAPLTVRLLERRLPGTVGPAAEAEPHGTVFEKPVGIRFTLSPGDISPGIAFGQLRVATLNNGRWEVLPTRFPSPGVIEGLTTHFSTFSLVAPCLVSGTGNDFPLTGCPTFTPEIQTSDNVTLQAMAASLTLVLWTRPSASSTQVTFTVRGLSPIWTYFLSLDGSGQLASVTTDAAGTLTFAQDLSAGHLLILMDHHGSISLTSTTCLSPVASWDASTRTCTLLQDVATPTVYLTEDNFTLDCAGHTVGGSTKESVGIGFAYRTNLGVRNCQVTNVDYGVLGSGTNIVISNTQAAVSDAIVSGGIGLNLYGTSVTLDGVSSSGFDVGFATAGSTAVTLKNANLRVRRSSIILESSTNVSLDSVTLDATLAQGTSTPSAPNTPQYSNDVAAVNLSASHGVTIRGLNSVGNLAMFENVVAALMDSDVAVINSTISNSATSVRLDGPGSSRIHDNVFGGAGKAVVLNGGTNTVFHNNFTGSDRPAIAAAAPVELSDSTQGSPTFGQGNYWGHSCPGSLFFASTDSNRPDVVDSFPYGAANAWVSGGTPGCQTVVLTPPVITVPALGALLATTTPTFQGTSTPGTSVDIVESSVVKGTGLTTSSGDFTVVTSSPFTQGLHVVAARARLDGGVSADSNPIAFTVDTIPPAAPVITTPANGSTTNDSNVGIRGSAETGATVTIRESTSVIGTAVASSGSFMLFAANTPSGTHLIAATATDAAGNVSPQSLVVQFTVKNPTLTSPLVGVQGRLSLTSVSTTPNPFDPTVGQVSNTIAIGQFKLPPGLAHGRPLVAQMTQRITDLATGLPVATITRTTPIATPQNGAQPVHFNIITPFDGTATGGGTIQPGFYGGSTTVAVGLNLPNGGLQFPFPSPQPTCNGSAGCLFDVVDFNQIVGFIPLPLPDPHPIGDCGTGKIIIEVCNGIDDNCNGLVDEGSVCESLPSSCPCAPLSCLDVRILCGTIPDGCGQEISCGGPCR